MIARPTTIEQMFDRENTFRSRNTSRDRRVRSPWERTSLAWPSV
jgi:hypothetical protein